MIEIDETKGTVTRVDGAKRETFPIGSPEGFELVSNAWLRAGWDAKHVYTFTWLGRPIIQLPEDMFRIQELIYALKPDAILETGVAHGGSAVFFASLCKLMNHGRVVSVDVEIREHNRKALEAHELKPLITLIEGDSIAPDTVSQVEHALDGAASVLVILDSNHTKAHVLAELEAYAPFVSVGSYCIACDGIMASVAGAPRTKPEWTEDNPIEAVKEFLDAHKEFRLAPPAFAFNESGVSEPITYWPSSHLLRVA